MDEAKEVHTTLRTAAGIFKFVKVLVVAVVVLKWFYPKLLNINYVSDTVICCDCIFHKCT